MTRFFHVGSTDRFGEIEIWATGDLVTVTAAGLPSVEIRHPNGINGVGHMPLNTKTVLLVGGVQAVLSPGRGRSTADRAMRVELSGRKYTYRFTDGGDEELRREDGTALARHHLKEGVKGFIVSTIREADDTDLALAIAFTSLETHTLSLAGAVIGGVLGFFNNPQGLR